MSKGEDVTDYDDDKRLQKAAQLTELNKDDLEYRGTADGAVAILIYQYESNGEASGLVMFADENGTVVETGQENLGKCTVLLYSALNISVFVSDAKVDYIRKKK